MELEKGKLYQVYTGSKWVIAEYVNTVEAHVERYSNIGFGGKHGITISPEKSRNVPTQTVWKGIWSSYNTYRAEAKPSNIRPVTDETLAEIARLRAEIKRLEQEKIAAIRELKDLCN